MADKWWVISETALLKALTDAHRGDSPEVVLMELLANSESKDFREGDHE